MQLPKLTFKKTVLITVVLNVILYNFLNSSFKVIFKNASNETDDSDLFSDRKSSELRQKILDQTRANLTEKLLKQKYFTSNLSIYTLKDADKTIYTDEENFNKSKFYSNNNDPLIKHIINNPTLNPRNIKIYSAPVKIELIKSLSNSTSTNPNFDVILNDSASVILSHENLLHLSTDRNDQKYRVEYRAYPAKVIVCPGSNPRPTKSESLAKMENVINQAPFMKKIVDMDRFRSKSNKPNIMLCFWLKISSYEQLIKSDMYLTALAPEYSRIRIK